MKKKIKINIQSPKFNMKLPALSIKSASKFMLFALKYADDENNKENVLENEELIKSIIKELDSSLNVFEPFTLVEVISEDTNIKIDII